MTKQAFLQLTGWKVTAKTSSTVREAIFERTSREEQNLIELIRQVMKSKSTVSSIVIEPILTAIEIEV